MKAAPMQSEVEQHVKGCTLPKVPDVQDGCDLAMAAHL